MRRLWPFRLSVALFALALCYLAGTMAIATVEQRKLPLSALNAAPYNAQALANAAFASLESDRSPPALAKAHDLARRAIGREPINVAGLRTLGLIATVRHDLSAARARFALVERLSRRDLPSQLWWIEYEVSRGDIIGALSYFDEALRTSPSSADLLLPVLVNAAQEAPIAAALVPLLRSRPTYLRPFFIRATDTNRDVGEVAKLGPRLLDRENPDDQDLINRIIARLGKDRRYDEAWRTFVWANGSAPSGFIVNGDFDHPSAFGLFNWTPVNAEELSAEILPRDGSNSLYLVARVSRGLVTRQLLRLSPGRYRLSAQVGDVPEAALDRPSIGITCAQDDHRILAPTPFPPSTSKASLTTTFVAEAGCRYQWLDLQASASSEDETRAWIDDVRIARVGLDPH